MSVTSRGLRRFILSDIKHFSKKSPQDTAYSKRNRRKRLQHSPIGHFTLPMLNVCQLAAVSDLNVNLFGTNSAAQNHIITQSPLKGASGMRRPFLLVLAVCIYVLYYSGASCTKQLISKNMNEFNDDI